MIGLIFLSILSVQSRKKKNEFDHRCFLSLLVEIYENTPQESNQFLKGKISTKHRYEQSRETVENIREVNEY